MIAIRVAIYNEWNQLARQGFNALMQGQNKTKPIELDKRQWAAGVSNEMNATLNCSDNFVVPVGFNDQADQQAQLDHSVHHEGFAGVLLKISRTVMRNEHN